MLKIGSAKFYIAIGVLIVIFLPPFAKYQELRYRNQKLGERITELQRENKKLDEDRRRLETDIAYIERRAREKVGYVRKGEIVLKEVPAKKK